MIVLNKKILVFTLVLFMNTVNVLSQSHEPPVPEARNAPPGLPIDNDIIILFTIAMAYGIYKLVQRSKKSA
ncbi:hypothetical protein BXY82_0846 [Gelidibacter sediminis]|uniref:Uncharacterized protein n=1 Tax=Gelidibacter sediminis TaxID=1608710 RepID=A0A4R7Q7C7_9FLAO|nr:hypothetical protein [Gelidibacter sediminis]TDU43434.1 hypothetical protein BXY82_0846 [Gelidibacter sediminis]